MRIAVFPGTFDPITMGHQDILLRAMSLFDKIIVGIGTNSNKQPMFSLEQRISWIQEIFKDHQRISVQSYDGLTSDFCKREGAQFLLRGIRNNVDFEYEKSIADMNRVIHPGLETIFLACSPQYVSYSSTIVRDIIKHGGAYEQFVPNIVSVSHKK